MPNRKELLDFLDDIESRYPVENWVINGVYVWPLIKIDLFFKHVKYEGKDKVIEEQKDNKRLGLTFSINVIKSLGAYLKFLISKPLNVDILFVDSPGHRIWMNGAFINRYFEPIKGYVKEILPNFTSITINDEEKDFNKYNHKEDIFFINKYIYGAKILNLFRRRERSSSLPNFSSFINELTNFISYLGLERTYESYLRRRVSTLVLFEQIVQKIIVKYKPRLAFELCYYSSLCFSVNLATHKKRIRTIEIQHGGMGRDHVSYNRWSKIPNIGYNLLPQVFWTWDVGSEALINNWIKKQEFHKVILGGNPWLSYSLSLDNTPYEFPNDKKIILYTIQYSQIEDYIVDAILNSPSEYQWWIRLHPRKVEAKEHIIDSLYASRVPQEKIEIDKACNYPLPQILKYAYIHMSGSSGAIIEAAQIGIPSLILDEIGIVYYDKLIDLGVAKACVGKSASMLLADIEACYELNNRFGAVDQLEIYKEVLKHYINEENIG